MFSSHELNRFLLENMEDIDAQAFKEYCADEELTPQDALDKFSSDIEGVVEGLYESACEAFGVAIDRFDYGELFNSEVDTSFINPALLISFIRQQARKCKEMETER